MKIKTIIAAIALMAAPLCVSAQTEADNEKISENLKNEIGILNADIKALKARKKADPTNTTYDAEIATKQAALKEAKDRKSIIDNAIKAESKAKKETKQAESAQKKHEKAHKDAESLKASNSGLNGKSNELISDELDAKIGIVSADIKALKARKKANPTDAAVLKQISDKEVELKELKRQKKVIDTAIKARKTAEKETDQAEKAQKKHENAHEKAEKMKSNM